MVDPLVNPTPPGPRRPDRSAKREAAALQTRARIRDAAETLFLRDGYAGTSMKAIAAQAGVSEKTMYLTYATRPGCCAASSRSRPAATSPPPRCLNGPTGARSSEGP